MEIKFDNKVVTVQDEQAVSCFHSLKVISDAEGFCDGVTADLWLKVHSSLTDICNHYADGLRADNNILDGTDWDFIE